MNFFKVPNVLLIKRITMKYWIFKSEPSVFSIDDLIAAPNQTTVWDGVRNYQARNFLRDEVKLGDKVFFYHSNNDDETGIVGLCEVIKEAYPDPSQFDPNSKYYDPKATPQKPIWISVDIKFIKKFEKILTISQIKSHPILSTMLVAKKGNRLSVTPINEEHYQCILDLCK